MSNKAKSGPVHDAATLAVELDEDHRDQVDAFLERNRDVLNIDLRRSRADLANGEHSVRDVDQIIADGRRRHGESS